MVNDKIFNRYYSLHKVSYLLDRSNKSVREYIDMFNIKTVQNNGKTSITGDTLEHLESCVKLKKVSNMKPSYIKGLPKHLIKELINRL